MGIAETIRNLRIQAGLSQQRIADELDVDRSAVAQWENGITEPRMGNIRRLAEYFGIPVSSLVDEGAPASGPSVVAVRALGKVHAGPFSEEEEADGTIEVPASILASHPRAGAVIVEGDCMNRVAPEGVAVIYDPDLEPASGQIVIVETEDHEALMRRYYRAGNTLVLVADSYQEHDDIVIASGCPIRLIGTVVWMQAPLDREG